MRTKTLEETTFKHETFKLYFQSMPKVVYIEFAKKFFRFGKSADLPTDKDEVFVFRYYVKVKNESFPEIVRDIFQLR